MLIVWGMQIQGYKGRPGEELVLPVSGTLISFSSASELASLMGLNIVEKKKKSESQGGWTLIALSHKCWILVYTCDSKLFLN